MESGGWGCSYPATSGEVAPGLARDFGDAPKDRIGTADDLARTKPPVLFWTGASCGGVTSDVHDGPAAWLDCRSGAEGRLTLDRGRIYPRHQAQEVVAAETGGREARGGPLDSRNTTSAEDVPDARSALLSQTRLTAMVAPPGHPAQPREAGAKEEEGGRFGDG